MKELRNMVRGKFGGKCAFCGCILSSCHIWDIKPVGFVVNQNGELLKDNYEIENLMPACKSCESTRRKHGEKVDIETFRKDIEQSFRFLRSGGLTATSYGKAIRFDLIRETHKPVVFYFEELQNSYN